MLCLCLFRQMTLSRQSEDVSSVCVRGVADWNAGSRATKNAVVCLGSRNEMGFQNKVWHRWIAAGLGVLTPQLSSIILDSKEGNGTVVGGCSLHRLLVVLLVVVKRMEVGESMSHELCRVIGGMKRGVKIADLQEGEQDLTRE